MKPMTAVLIGTALSVVGVMCAAASAGIARQQLTIYGKATQVQSIDHSDDRARGVDHNPFNADTKLIVPRMKHKEKGKGTLPGDNALYSFKLYRDSSLQKSVGSAVYSCTFNFAHHALCQGTFQLTGGMMFASGPADFDGTGFTLAVTGGTSKYLGVRGEVTVLPAAKDANRLDFELR